MKNLFSNALALAVRCRDSEGLRTYLQERQALILAAGAVMLLMGFACAAGVATFLAGLRTWMTLPALVLGSLFLLASVLVQVYVFFSWLEGRALAKALGHRTGPAPGPAVQWIDRTFGTDVGPAPAIPWPLVGTVVFLPVLLLALTAPVGAIVIALIGSAVPVVFARLESDLAARPRADDAET
jgi:hypothetical protein